MSIAEDHGRSQDFGSQNTIGGRPGGGGGPGRTPRAPENFRKFSNNFIRKLLKMLCFSIFFKICNKPCVNFSRVGTEKTVLGNFEKILKFCEENSIENLNFSLFLENWFLKMKPSEITSLFYNIFQFHGRILHFHLGYHFLNPHPHVN